LFSSLVCCARGMALVQARRASGTPPNPPPPLRKRSKKSPSFEETDPLV